MFGDLFDSPWKLLIIAAVILVLFGSRKMPDAARSLGRSMRILKSEVQGMRDEEGKEASPTTAYVPGQQGTAPQTAEYGTAQQPQELTAGTGSPVGTGSPAGAAAPAAEAQRASQPS